MYKCLSSHFFPIVTGWIGAISIEDQRMVHYIKLEKLAYRILYVLDPRITELHYFMTFRTDQMVVLFISIRLFVLRHILAKLMFGNQVTFNEQVQGVIHSSPAHPIIFVLHTDVQRFHIKVTVPGIYLLQNGKSLWCFPQFFLFKVSCKNLLDLRKYFFV